LDHLSRSQRADQPPSFLRSQSKTLYVSQSPPGTGEGIRAESVKASRSLTHLNADDTELLKKGEAALFRIRGEKYRKGRGGGNQKGARKFQWPCSPR